MYFKTFIYHNEKTISEYLRMITNKDRVSKKSMSRKADFKTNVGVISAGVGITSESDFDYQPSFAEQYDLFEKNLESHKKEAYFDFSDSDSDPLTVPPGAIIKLGGRLEVPESFERLQLVSKFLPLIRKSDSFGSDVDGLDMEFMSNIFANDNFRIPAIVDCDNVCISAKLKFQYLKDGYEGLNDQLGSDVVCLCKVIRVHKEGEVIVFDPLKDFMQLNRAMRRQVSRNEQSQEIKFEAPLIEVEMLSMYY